MDNVRVMLKQAFQTTNDMTLAISGTGSAGGEGLMANLLEPGDTALFAVNGVFAGRLADMAGRCGATVTKIEAPWGTVFDQDELIKEDQRGSPEAFLHRARRDVVAAHQPVDKLGEAVHAAGGLFVLDCVTSLGGCWC